MLQEALADPQLQAVKAQLERRGLSIKADEAQAVQLAGGQQLLIPFGEDAHLVWTRANGQTAAVGLIRQGNKTLNVSADGQERVVRFLPVQKVEKLVRKLREKSKFQEFEGKLAQKGKRVGKIRVLFDETNQIAILGIANEGDEEKIAHQVRIKVKAGKDDEPEDDAEPAIQATACGQATGEAVPTGAKMQPLTAPPGEWDIVEGGYEGPELCTSQWGYDYLCISRTPAISLSTTSLTLPQTFINQQTQASFIIWNSGGGTLTGTVSVPAPFSITSGASFSLLPGQPQEVVVKFSSATAGSFSKSVTINSNGGSATVTATAVAHKVSFSPAQLDFGSGLLVLREQCNDMGVCGLHTEKVGLPIEKTLTVKNEGSVAVTLTLSTAAPYKIVSVLPTLSPGQSGQVTVRFDPNESGSFTGAVQVGIQNGQGSVTSSPLVGVAHKIEFSPAELNFGIVFVGGTGERKLTVKNQGMTTVTLEVPNTTQNTTSPFRVMLESLLVLGPSESKEVTVQFSPLGSGTFTGDIRLISGQNNVSVPAIGAAYGLEEFLASLSWAYNIIFAEDVNRGSQLLLAGFDDLSLEQIKELLDFYEPQAAEAGATDPEWLTRIQQASALLSSLGIAQTNAWLQALAQALQENRFEEEYNQLLPQGLDKLVKATLLIVGIGDMATDSSEAKQVIRNLLTTLLEQGNPLDAIRWMQQIVEEALCQTVTLQLCGLIGTLRYLHPGWLLWKSLYYDPFKQAWDQFISLFVDPTRGVITPVGYRASQAIMFIGVNMAKNLPPSLPGIQVINTIDLGISSFRDFLVWATNDISRKDQALGTLFSAASASVKGWHAHPFRVEGQWAAAVLVLKNHEIPGINKDIMVLLRGDNCADCAANAGQIVDWVKTALQRINDRGNLFNPGLGAIYSKDMRIIVLSFTNKDATGVDEVINKLRAAKDNSGTPILYNTEVLIAVVYWDSNGQPAVACISLACEIMKRDNPDGYDKLMQKLKEAFNGAIAAYPGLDPQSAWWLAYGICGGDVECIFFFAEQLAKEPPQPKDDLCPPIPDDVPMCQP